LVDILPLNKNFKKMKRDLLTGEVFEPKRINQKFSCPTNRIRFNNNKAKEIRHHTAYINNPLNQNFRILKELEIGKKELIFHRQFLLGKGFNFHVFNNTCKYENQICYAIYHFIIVPMPNDQIKIVPK
jgi:hypothetical protein